MTASRESLAPFRALVSQRFGLGLPERFDRPMLHALDDAGAVMGVRERRMVPPALEALPWTAPAWQAAIDRITVRETSFFRQRSWWDSVTEMALKPLIAARRRDGTRRLRCLSIGCASGEEPYSLAITIARLLGHEPGWSVEIIGADLCASALDQARAGLYDARAIREVSETDRALWFRPEGAQRYRLDAHMREKVRFCPFNLLEAMAGPPRGGGTALSGRQGRPRPVPERAHPHGARAPAGDRPLPA